MTKRKTLFIWMVGIVFLALSLAFVYAESLTKPSNQNHSPPALPGDGNADEQASSVTRSWRLLSSANGDLDPPTTRPRHTITLILDINKDGLNDFVIGSQDGSGPTLVWYERGVSGWTRYTIESGDYHLAAGGAYYDIDGDGDLDIVAGHSNRGNQLWWWENPYPDFSPSVEWTRRVIKSDGCTKHHDMMFGDFDANGIAELVFWNQNSCEGQPAGQLFRAEIPADAATRTTDWPRQQIYASGLANDEGLDQGDIDLDGLPDIVAGGHWFKYNGGNSFTPNLIERINYGRIAVADLIPGNRPEIVQTPGDAVGKARLFEWNGSTWVGRDLLPENVFYAHSLQIADIDQDGHLDIFIAEMRYADSKENPDADMWILFGNSRGDFTTQVIANGYDNHESKLGDLDGDGDLDIVGKPFAWGTPRVDVWLNEQDIQPGCEIKLDSWETHIIDDARPWRALFIDSADLDGDGFEDIVTGSWWYRNPGNNGGNWERYPIDDRLAGATSPVTGTLNQMWLLSDLDGDGLVDILGSEWLGGTAPADRGRAMVWARNRGNGRFDIINTTIAPSSGDFPQGVALADFKPGEKEVVISWHLRTLARLDAVKIGPLSNSSWALRTLSTITQSEEVSVGDIDRDGDPDLLLGTIWLQNNGDGDNFTDFNIDDEPGPDRNHLADIDQDGLIDAVVSFESTNSSQKKLVWYKAPEDLNQAWTENLVANLIAPMSLDVADADKDGDLDIVAGEHNNANPASGRVFLYENVNNGSSWISHLVATGHEHHDGTQFVDFDRDSDLDVISIGYNNSSVLLYENTSCRPVQQPTRTPNPPPATPDPVESATPTATSTASPQASVTPTATATPASSPDPSPTQATCPPSIPSNVVKNPGFEEGKTNWKFVTNGKGTFTTTTSNPYQCLQAAQVSIQVKGSNVQLNQANIALQPKTRYRLTIAARSSTGRDVQVSVHKHTSPYTNYGLNNVNLDLRSEWQVFTVEFETSMLSAPVTDGRLRIGLNNGLAGDEFFFDDVVLSPVSAEPNTATPTMTATLPIPSSTPSDGDTPTPTPTPIASPQASVTPTATAGPTDTPPATPACIDPATTFLKNPGFESGTTNWKFYSNVSGNRFTYGTDPNYSCGRFGQVSINTSGSNVQLNQSGLIIEKGKTYRLRFDAKANGSSSIGVLIHLNLSPYTNLGLDVYPVTLTTDWQSFEYTFVAMAGTTDARLRLRLNGVSSGSVLFFDNFYLNIE